MNVLVSVVRGGISRPPFTALHASPSPLLIQPSRFLLAPASIRRLEHLEKRHKLPRPKKTKREDVIPEMTKLRKVKLSNVKNLEDHIQKLEKIIPVQPPSIIQVLPLFSHTGMTFTLAQRALDIARRIGRMRPLLMEHYLAFVMSKMGTVEDVYKAIDLIKFERVRLTVKMYNMLLNILLKNNKVNEALKVYEDMKEKEKDDIVVRDCATYTLFISFFQQRDTEMAVHFFRDLQNSKKVSKLTGVSLHILARSMAKYAPPELSLEVLQLISDKGYAIKDAGITTMAHLIVREEKDTLEKVHNKLKEKLTPKRLQALIQASEVKAKQLRHLALLEEQKKHKIDKEEKLQKAGKFLVANIRRGKVPRPRLKKSITKWKRHLHTKRKRRKLFHKDVIQALVDNENLQAFYRTQVKRRLMKAEKEKRKLFRMKRVPKIPILKEYL